MKADQNCHWFRNYEWMDSPLFGYVCPPTHATKSVCPLILLRVLWAIWILRRLTTPSGEMIGIFFSESNLTFWKNSGTDDWETTPVYARVRQGLEMSPRYGKD